MANTVYPKGKEALLSGLVNIPSDTIKVALVTATYVYSAAHDFYNDVSGVISTPQTLGSKTITSGVFSAANPVFPSVTAGSTARGLIVYKDTGTPSTSPLLAFIDTNGDTTPINIVTDGTNITVAWSGGRVFRI